jgi:hypothetical protein
MMRSTDDTLLVPQPPEDENHAMLVGAVAGMFLVAQGRGFQYTVELIDDDDGTHLDCLDVSAPSGRYRIAVKKVS